MSAGYDSFDYPLYWTDREYEHKSELIALDAFFSQIHKSNTILEVGCGFGRLALFYADKTKKIILSDPSIKLLSIAKDTLKKRKNISYIKATLQKLPTLVKPGSVDVVVMVRVIHHIEDIDGAIDSLHKIIKPGGYLILEFANKRHAKAVFMNMLHKNFSYRKDTQTIDRRNGKNKKNGTLPFLNYHPEIIDKQLGKFDFEIIDRRSVSNIRLRFAKKIFPLSVLLQIESILQNPLARLYFGPSIFVLAKKKSQSKHR